jgi:hypothetical protein
MMQLKLFDIEPAYERFNVSGRFTGLLQKVHKSTHFTAYFNSADCKLFSWFIVDGSWIIAKTISPFVIMIALYQTMNYQL